MSGTAVASEVAAGSTRYAAAARGPGCCKAAAVTADSTATWRARTPGSKLGVLENAPQRRMCAIAVRLVLADSDASSIVRPPGITDIADCAPSCAPTEINN